MALVVFLRGVNVGGHKTFRPSVLARELDRFAVTGIGAAGTFVARQPGNRAKLRKAFADRLPFDAEIMICEGREIRRLVEGDPFAGVPKRAELVRFVSVLARSPRSLPAIPFTLPASAPASKRPAARRKGNQPGGDDWLVQVLSLQGKFVLGVYRRNMQAVSQLGTLDRMFGVSATTRNWNTISKIAAELKR